MMTAPAQIDRGRGPRQRVAGWTLVELMVVVAIIVLLTAVLLPSLGRSRSQAHVAVCQSNLKQVGIGVMAYAIDHRQAIPFGPGQDAITMLDFYRFPGMVTSLLSTLQGEPVGLGLLLRSYLADKPEIMFCPGSDQKIVAAKEMAKFGSGQAQSSYWYRHGSAAVPTDAVTHIRTDGRHVNRHGQPLRALAMDSNFVAHPELAAFNVNTRTHHGLERVSVLFLDGSADNLINTNGRFTVDVGVAPQNGPDGILSALEIADSTP